MKIPFFNYPSLFKEHEAEYTKVVLDVMKKGAYIFGEEHDRFEKKLADFVGTKHAIGVNNCTDALQLSLMAAGVNVGDEVISVSHTFVATIEVIAHLGATPVLVDIDEGHTMDVGLVEQAITPKTKAIIPVQLNGRICEEMDELVKLARQHSLAIIEDSAQGLGATYNGVGAGAFGLSGNFSFYPAKLLGAFGDAGAITTNDDAFAEKVRLLRNHGRKDNGDIVMWGLNSRLDNVHAAILEFKLDLLPSWLERRREIASLYHEGLNDIASLALPCAPQTGVRYDVYQNYELEAESRNELRNYLSEKGIGTLIQWGGKAVHQHQDLGIDVSLPVTERMFERSLMLPMNTSLSNEDVGYIIDSVRTFYKN